MPEAQKGVGKKSGVIFKRGVNQVNHLQCIFRKTILDFKFNSHIGQIKMVLEFQKFLFNSKNVVKEEVFQNFLLKKNFYLLLNFYLISPKID